MTKMIYVNSTPYKVTLTLGSQCSPLFPRVRAKGLVREKDAALK